MSSIKTRATAARLALALLALSLGSVLVAAPAEAGWTNASGVTKLHVCRTATPSGNGWIFHARVQKRADTEEARGGITVYDGRRARQRWSSDWLEDGEVERGEVRAPRSRRIRLHVWQEAGDLDSPVGTALELAVYRPRQITHC